MELGLALGLLGPLPWGTQVLSDPGLTGFSPQPASAQPSAPIRRPAAQPPASAHAGQGSQDGAVTGVSRATLTSPAAQVRGRQNRGGPHRAFFSPAVPHGSQLCETHIFLLPP